MDPVRVGIVDQIIHINAEDEGRCQTKRMLLVEKTKRQCKWLEHSAVLQESCVHLCYFERLLSHGAWSFATSSTSCTPPSSQLPLSEDEFSFCAQIQVYDGTMVIVASFQLNFPISIFFLIAL